MRSLLLLRHAKSDRGAQYPSDHARPLNSRGRRAAAAMGRFLAAVDRVPALAVTSTAERARTTVELAMDAGEWECPLVETDDLYLSGPEEVLAVAATLPEDASPALLAGHEPTFSAVVDLLTGARVDFVTGAVAAIDVHVERWASIRPGTGTLTFFVPPRLLTDGRIRL